MSWEKSDLPLTLRELHHLALPAKPEPEDSGVLYQSNAMNGEAGEVANIVKKMVRDGPTTVLDLLLVDECGDVLFYMRQLLEQRGFTLEDAAHTLLNKLEEIKARTA